jgi:hypothetical protein
MIPYAAGMTGLLVAGLVAVRWSRRAAREPGVAERSEDATLGSRLDDELRDLD